MLHLDLELLANDIIHLKEERTIILSPASVRVVLTPKTKLRLKAKGGPRVDQPGEVVWWACSNGLEFLICEKDIAWVERGNHA